MSSYSSKFVHSIEPAEKPNSLKNLHVMALGDSDIANKVLPSAGTNYIRQGMIVKDDACYNAFISRGWEWGGNWKELKDYQHFQKTDTLKKEGDL